VPLPVLIRLPIPVIGAERVLTTKKFCADAIVELTTLSVRPVALMLSVPPPLAAIVYE
jgi:hypothetical protein